MALNLKLADAAVNAEANAFAALFNNGFLRIYSGAQPATADTAITTQTLLAEHAFANPAFGSAVSGVITANPIADDTDVNATGTATWFRCFESDGVTPILDGSVDAVTGNEIIANTSFTIHGTASVASFTHTVTK